MLLDTGAGGHLLSAPRWYSVVDLNQPLSNYKLLVLTYELTEYVYFELNT